MEQGREKTRVGEEERERNAVEIAPEAMVTLLLCKLYVCMPFCLKYTLGLCRPPYARRVSDQTGESQSTSSLKLRFLSIPQLNLRGSPLHTSF